MLRIIRVCCKLIAPKFHVGRVKGNKGQFLQGEEMFFIVIDQLIRIILINLCVVEPGKPVFNDLSKRQSKFSDIA